MQWKLHELQYFISELFKMHLIHSCFLVEVCYDWLKKIFILCLIVLVGYVSFVHNTITFCTHNNLTIWGVIFTVRTLSCNVWLGPVFEVKYPCFPTTWILCTRSRFSWILYKRSRLLVTWLCGINDKVSYPLWCHLVPRQHHLHIVS